VHDAYIVGAVRSPIGRRNGGLSSVHPVDLAAHVPSELFSRTGVDPAAIEGVLSGTQDMVIAAGVESMSMVPMGTTTALPMKAGLASPFGPGWRDRYGDQESLPVPWRSAHLRELGA